MKKNLEKILSNIKKHAKAVILPLALAPALYTASCVAQTEIWIPEAPAKKYYLEKKNSTYQIKEKKHDPIGFKLIGEYTLDNKGHIVPIDPSKIEIIPIYPGGSPDNSACTPSAQSQN